MTDYLFAFTSIILTAFAQLLLKRGAVTVAAVEGGSLVARLFQVVSDPHIIGGVAIYGLSTLFWLRALAKLRLSVAYPLVSLSYVIVLAGSYWFLGEKISSTQIFGVGMIMVGVLCLVR
jgi:drug/metabolite transporter (DMT)-like permease